MHKLSKELEKMIEEEFKFSIEILKRLKVHNRILEFYIQNKNKIVIEEFGEEAYFIIKDNKLERSIKKVLKEGRKETKSYFSEEEMSKYLWQIGYRGLPPTTISFAEVNKRIEKI